MPWERSSGSWVRKMDLEWVAAVTLPATVVATLLAQLFSRGDGSERRELSARRGGARAPGSAERDAMMRRGIVVAVFVLLGPTLAVESFAQGGLRWRGGGGWGPGTAYGRLFDVSTVETASGEVVSVDLITPRKGMTSGVHLVLDTDQGPLSVHLGPEWYVSRQETRIEPSDTVEALLRACRRPRDASRVCGASAHARRDQAASVVPFLS